MAAAIRRPAPIPRTHVLRTAATPTTIASIQAGTAMTTVSMGLWISAASVQLLASPAILHRRDEAALRAISPAATTCLSVGKTAATHAVRNITTAS